MKWEACVLLSLVGACLACNGLQADDPAPGRPRSNLGHSHDRGHSHDTGHSHNDPLDPDTTADEPIDDGNIRAVCRMDVRDGPGRHMNNIVEEGEAVADVKECCRKCYQDSSCWGINFRPLGILPFEKARKQKDVIVSERLQRAGSRCWLKNANTAINGQEEGVRKGWDSGIIDRDV